MRMGLESHVYTLYLTSHQAKELCIRSPQHPGDDPCNPSSLAMYLTRFLCLNSAVARNDLERFACLGYSQSQSRHCPRSRSALSPEISSRCVRLNRRSKHYQSESAHIDTLSRNDRRIRLRESSAPRYYNLRSEYLRP